MSIDVLNIKSAIVEVTSQLERCQLLDLVLWLDQRVAEFKVNGSFAKDCKDINGKPTWIKDLVRKKQNKFDHYNPLVQSLAQQTIVLDRELTSSFSALSEQKASISSEAFPLRSSFDRDSLTKTVLSSYARAQTAPSHSTLAPKESVIQHLLEHTPPASTVSEPNLTRKEYGGKEFPRPHKDYTSPRKESQQDYPAAPLDPAVPGQDLTMDRAASPDLPPPAKEPRLAPQASPTPVVPASQALDLRTDRTDYPRPKERLLQSHIAEVKARQHNVIEIKEEPEVPPPTRQPRLQNLIRQRLMEDECSAVLERRQCSKCDHHFPTWPEFEQHLQACLSSPSLTDRPSVAAFPAKQETLQCHQCHQIVECHDFSRHAATCLPPLSSAEGTRPPVSDVSVASENRKSEPLNYMCPECGCVFLTERETNEHMRAEHQFPVSQHEFPTEVQATDGRTIGVEQVMEERVHYCGNCKNHGFLVRRVGHKPQCPYRDCKCERCAATVLYRERDRLIKATKLRVRQGSEGGDSRLTLLNSRYCGNCKNHGTLVRRAGHKAVCPFGDCQCPKCRVTLWYRERDRWTKKVNQARKRAKTTGCILDASPPSSAQSTPPFSAGNPFPVGDNTTDDMGYVNEDSTSSQSNPLNLPESILQESIANTLRRSKSEEESLYGQSRVQFPPMRSLSPDIAPRPYSNGISTAAPLSVAAVNPS